MKPKIAKKGGVIVPGLDKLGPVLKSLGPNDVIVSRTRTEWKRARK